MELNTEIIFTHLHTFFHMHKILSHYFRTMCMQSLMPLLDIESVCVCVCVCVSVCVCMVYACANVFVCVCIYLRHPDSGCVSVFYLIFRNDCVA